MGFRFLLLLAVSLLSVTLAKHGGVQDQRHTKVAHDVLEIREEQQGIADGGPKISYDEQVVEDEKEGKGNRQRRRSTESNSLRALVESLASGLVETDSAIGNLQIQIESLISGLAEKDSAIGSLQSQIEALTSGLAEKDSAISTVQNQIESLTSRLAEKNSELNSHQSQIDELKSANTELVNTVSSVETMLVDLNNRSIVAFSVEREDFVQRYGRIPLRNRKLSIGPGYDVSANEFAVVVPGIYVFIYDVETLGNGIDFLVQIQKNGARYGDHFINDFPYRSGTIILELKVGDKVGLALLTRSKVKVERARLSGFLLSQMGTKSEDVPTY